jgi:hypothetical protein
MKTENLTAQLVKDAIKNLVGVNTELYFDDELSVKLNPHSAPLLISGACVDNNNQIQLMKYSAMTGNPNMPYEDWFPLEEKDVNYGQVLHSLYQRVYILTGIDKIKKSA